MQTKFTISVDYHVLICHFQLFFVSADITTDTSLKMKDTVQTIINMLGAPRNYGTLSLYI